jgi:hypothetical protein
MSKEYVKPISKKKRKIKKTDKWSI